MLTIFVPSGGIVGRGEVVCVAGVDAG